MDADPAKNSWTAREKREEQLKNWQNSETDVQSDVLSNSQPRVKFDEGAVFLAACSSGDLEEVDYLLKKGADINCANIDGLTALHQACIDEKLQVVRFLVNMGITVDQQDNEGWTPLHAAASCGFLDIARFLVRSGANVAAVNSEGEIPSDIADDDDMREYLEREVVRQGLNVEEAKNHEREVMLMDARKLAEMVESGEKTALHHHHHPKSGATPLHVAAAKGYNDVLKLLIQVGMDVNACDNDNWTPLHAASHWGHEQAAKILADRGADFQAKSRLGQTPNDVADDEMIKYMNRLSLQQKLLNNDKKEPPPQQKANFHIDDAASVSSQSDESTSSSSSSSSSEEEEVVHAPTIMRSRPPIAASVSTATTASPFQRRTTTTTANPRPASVHIAALPPSADNITTRRNITSTSSTKPILAVQPNERISSSSSSSSSMKDDSPSTWRSGLRKTGSFEEKKQTSPRVSLHQQQQQQLGGSGDGTKQRHVADLIKDTNATISSIGENAGRTTARITPHQRSLTNLSRNKNLTADKSGESRKDEPSLTSLSNLSDEKQDKRRSHLQPVRDEEAEAQRKARSRRERQARRSTQGVTLDVYEEAKKHIDMQKKKHRTGVGGGDDGNATGDDHSNNGSLNRHRPTYHDGSSSSSLTTTTTASALPSSYVPQKERIPTTKATKPLPDESATGDTDRAAFSSSAPTITKTSAPSSGGSSQAATTSTRRRKLRTERRSTGIQNLDMRDMDGGSGDHNSMMGMITAQQQRDTSPLHQNRLSTAGYDREMFGGSKSTSSSSYPRFDDKDYKKLYTEEREESERLRGELKEARVRADEVEEKVKQQQRHRVLMLEKKLADMEKELAECKKVESKKEEAIGERSKECEDLRQENTVLKKLIDKLTSSSANSSAAKTSREPPRSSHLTAASAGKNCSSTSSSSTSSSPYLSRKHATSSSSSSSSYPDFLRRTPSTASSGVSSSSSTTAAGSGKYSAARAKYQSDKRPSFFRTAWKF